MVGIGQSAFVSQILGEYLGIAAFCILLSLLGLVVNVISVHSSVFDPKQVSLHSFKSSHMPISLHPFPFSMLFSQELSYFPFSVYLHYSKQNRHDEGNPKCNIHLTGNDDHPQRRTHHSVDSGSDSAVSAQTEQRVPDQ